MTEKLVVFESCYYVARGGCGEQAAHNRSKDLGYRDYLIWKMKYEKEARRKYKWPILQVLLQSAVTKLVLLEKVPSANLT